MITARSESDLTPEGIVNKVADSSGAKYSAASEPPAPPVASKPPPPAAKPAYTPSKSAGGFKPLAGSSRGVTPTSTGSGSGFNRAPPQPETDADGWGADAPPVTRTQLEKVKPAYTPTKVNMAELSQQPTGTTSNFDEQSSRQSQSGADVVKGGYQPIGKVDIAAIRRQARESGNTNDDRPEPVRGAYQPIGKVDIGAIRARAQQRDGSPEPGRPTAAAAPAAPRAPESADDDDDDNESSAPKSLAERAAAFKQSERISTLPKPKVTPKFTQASSFMGTKAPLPGAFDTGSQPTITGASRTFADRGGKTPAQLWAEKKARERGEPVPAAAAVPSGPTTPIAPQASGGASEGWKSGYAGKQWAPVQTNPTGGSAASAGGHAVPAEADRDHQQDMEEEEEEEEENIGGGVSSIRNRFAAAPPPMSAGGPPQLSMHNKPNAAGSPPVHEPENEEEEERDAPPPLPTASRPVPQPEAPPAMPARPPMPQPEPEPEQEEEEEEPIQPSSPVRIAMPVSRSAAQPEDEREEEEEHAAPAQQSLPIRSVPPAPADEPAAQAPAGGAPAGGAGSGITARAEYDYEKAEDNEIDLVENEIIHNVQKVDEDWWLGTNGKGETGLFPSNYVVEIESEQHTGGGAPAHEEPAPAAAPAPAPEPTPAPAAAGGPPAGGHTAKPSATSMYDYEAAEDNELGFPEGAKITNIVSLDLH